MIKINNGIKENDIVTIDYLGKLNSGKVVITSKNEGPLTFSVGHFRRIKGFNSAVLGMKVGQIKNCSFKPIEAFGTIDKNLLYKVPLINLPRNIQIGQKVSNFKKGYMFSIVDIDYNNSEAYLDANHAFAGEIISFCITIIGIKDPLPQSIKAEVEFSKQYGMKYIPFIDQSNEVSLI
ncbi:FKBP-type peptidyl-prolyl cis-trans isomerase [Bacteriovoracaceae bacterium]|nr:FKBP-type peptidyl-prolyl cis-trans isomerase [Bacteriovoracaceae bacterium]